MTVNIILNKADFQRHLNGCERRLNDLTKTLQTIDKFSQDQQLYIQQLNEITTEIKFLYSSILTLDQSSFALNGKKRLNSLKQNLEKTRIKFEQIQQYAHVKFNYDYQENSFEQSTEDQQQLMKLINNNNSTNEQIELDLLQQHTLRVHRLENDINEIHGAFIDINRLINEQGTIVDNIEQALTNTDEMIYEAKDHIQTTVQVKKRSKRFKWILIIFLISAFFLLIIILYFTLKLAFPLG